MEEISPLLLIICRCIVLVKILWKNEELCVWMMRLKGIHTLTIELNDKGWLLTFICAEREDILSPFHEHLYKFMLRFFFLLNKKHYK